MRRGMQKISLQKDQNSSRTSCTAKGPFEIHRRRKSNPKIPLRWDLRAAERLTSVYPVNANAKAPMCRPNPFASKASRHKLPVGLTLREKQTAA